jgi:UDP-glucose 4-epimerase
MDDVILVTGGAGFIGSHLVEALLHQGYTVRVLDDLSTGHLDNLRHLPSPPELIRASITDSDALDQALRNVRVVFHLAALASVARSMEQPVATHHACATGTLMLLDRARRQQVQRIVYAASSSAYGGLQGSDGAQSESLSVQPKSPYAAAKLAGELYLQAFGHALDCKRWLYASSISSDLDNVPIAPTPVSFLCSSQRCCKADLPPFTATACNPGTSPT